MAHEKDNAHEVDSKAGEFSSGEETKNIKPEVFKLGSIKRDTKNYDLVGTIEPGKFDYTSIYDND